MARPDDDTEAALSALEALQLDERQPRWVQHMAAAGVGQLRDIQRAKHAGNDAEAESLVKGLDQILPIGLRGTALLDELAGIVVVDDTASLVTVTVHWERVPRDRRKVAASLADFIVDLYYGRPEGGRPRMKQRRTPKESV